NEDASRTVVTGISGGHVGRHPERDSEPGSEEPRPRSRPKLSSTGTRHAGVRLTGVSVNSVTDVSGLSGVQNTDDLPKRRSVCVLQGEDGVENVRNRQVNTGGADRVREPGKERTDVNIQLVSHGSSELAQSGTVCGRNVRDFQHVSNGRLNANLSSRDRNRVGGQCRVGHFYTLSQTGGGELVSLRNLHCLGRLTSQLVVLKQRRGYHSSHERIKHHVGDDGRVRHVVIGRRSGWACRKV